jgi:hypothetical protein
VSAVPEAAASGGAMVPKRQRRTLRFALSIVKDVAACASGLLRCGLDDDALLSRPCGPALALASASPS